MRLDNWEKEHGKSIQDGTVAKVPPASLCGCGHKSCVAERMWQSTAKMGPPGGLQGHKRCSLLLKRAAEATARASTRHFPADPKCQRGFQLSLVLSLVPLSLKIQAGTCIFISHGGFTEKRAEGWKKKIYSLIHSLTNSFPHSLTLVTCSLNGGAYQALSQAWLAAWVSSL